MKDQCTIAEAKNKLPAIIHAVEKGSPIRLTRYGRPVAVLLSIEEYERLHRRRGGYWQALQSFRNILENENVIISDDDFNEIRDETLGRDVNLEEKI